MRFDAIAFDLYGTLLDISALEGALAKVLGAPAAALLAAWRKAQIERTWELNRLGRYEPFDRVTADALASVAPQLGAEPRARMCEAWLTVPAHPDAAAALRTLGPERCAVLSNGTAAMIRSALSAAKLPIATVRSVDEVRVYKPDPRVYALLDRLAPRERTLFVSANGWDADGCKRDGRTVAFIDRGGAPPALAPDLRVTSLAELASRAQQ
ncbi:MAG TPA: haloacid dehalogenase type II [Myxococcales bacterium]